MGLDMWLRAKTKVKLDQLSDYHTGVCSGLFEIVPDPEGMQEIGYWRNAHEQRSLILQYIDNNGNINQKGIENIIEGAKKVLQTHKFNEEGYDITKDNNDFSGAFYGTWQSKFKWEETVRIFTLAKEILENDPDAQIHYVDWY